MRLGGEEENWFLLFFHLFEKRKDFEQKREDESLVLEIVNKLKEER